ncbi:hypothetical protein PHLCEN_2v13287 [Hermanssonia centrifuga]|uniref:Cytochrome P450 n=1 Tax=Hermanssonia centrifuga TaxID=98765 RepID=A0A2R6NER2_9APHY|nr:hypothetical protein PHLCEN_2v13287 [Hermanssonia centrifuga]
MCKVSKIWLAYVASKGKQHLYIQDLHNRYGDAVRIGPNELSFNDANAVSAIMGSHGLPKGPNWGGRLFHNPIRSLIAIQDPREHLIRRKPWNRAFNTGSLKELQPLLAARVGQLVESVGKQEGVVDLSAWISFFTYDFMCDMAFGGGSEMMRDADPEGTWKKMEQGLSFALWLDHLPWLGYYAKVVQAAASDSFEFRTMAIKRIQERQRGGANRRDLMYFLTNEDIGGEQPVTRVLVADGILAIVAGSDTTSSVLSNAFFFLMTHPKVYEQLQAEVDRYYPPGENALDSQHHPKMSYLDAVINETMRMCPAVMSGSQRTTMAGTGGKAIGSHFLPEGTQARLHFYSVQRDPRNFSDPNSFWPERWLIAGGHMAFSEKLVHNPNAFVPFSHGPANCVGKSLAMSEMRIVICQMMQKVNMKFAPGWNSQNWERDLEDRYVTKKGSLPVIIEKRG